MLLVKLQLVLQPLQLPAEPHDLQLSLLLLGPGRLLGILQLGQLLLQPVNLHGEFLLLALVISTRGQEPFLGVLLVLHLVLQPLGLLLHLLQALLRVDHVLLGLVVLVLPGLQLLLEPGHLRVVILLAGVCSVKIHLRLLEVMFGSLQLGLDLGQRGPQVLDVILSLVVLLVQLFVVVNYLLHFHDVLFRLIKNLGLARFRSVNFTFHHINFLLQGLFVHFELFSFLNLSLQFFPHLLLLDTSPCEILIEFVLVLLVLPNFSRTFSSSIRALVRSSLSLSSFSWYFPILPANLSTSASRAAVSVLNLSSSP